MASLLLLLVAVGANTEPNSRLAVISRAPEFSLINQDNQKVHSADLQARALEAARAKAHPLPKPKVADQPKHVLHHRQTRRR